jgi:pyridoxine/pyridoxamine 5'-phosphate oxidase
MDHPPAFGRGLGGAGGRLTRFALAGRPLGGLGFEQLFELQERAMSLVLDDELKGIVNGALESHTPMVLASVDAEGRPRLTFRGSVQTFSDDQVGFWARNPEGGTMDNIAANPHVAMMMRNPETRVMLQLIGRARRVEGAERDRVYANAPEFEQRADAEKKGAAVIVDLDKVEGFLGMSADGQRRFVRLQRD